MKIGDLNISIDNDRMDDVFNKYKSIYEDLSTFISEELDEYDPNKCEENPTLIEISNGVFATLYDVCILRICANYKDRRIEHKLITAMIKFMNKYGHYKEYINRVSNDSESYYSRDYGIISTDGNNVSIIMHASGFYGIMRFSVSIFYNDNSNKINDEKEINYMCFDEAYAKMLEGHKITRPCFKGYWYINGVTGKPTIHLASGEEITTGDLSITLPNVLAKDWIVLE